MERVYPNEPDTEDQIVRVLNDLSERVEHLQEINGVGLSNEEKEGSY